MQPNKALVVTMVLGFILISCGNKQPVQYTSYYEPPVFKSEAPKSKVNNKYNFRETIESIQVEFIDKTNKVPKHIIEYLSRTYGIIEEAPRFAIKPYFRVEGYHFVFENNAPKDLMYYNYPDKVTFTITSAEKIITLKDVNPIPNIFDMKDQSLSFQAIYDKESNSIQSIIITNNSKTYVQVETISGYHYKNIKTNIIKKPFRLAPYSNITIDKKDIYFPIDLNINTNQFKEFAYLQYGYSVEYKLSNKTTYDTLHNLSNYAVKTE